MLFRYLCSSNKAFAKLTATARLAPRAALWRAYTNKTNPNVIHSPTGLTRKSPVTWASLIGVIIAGGYLTHNFREAKRAKMEEILFSPPIGKPKIGGPFTLIGTDNKAFSSESLKGSFFIMYFGFTHCPDICPDELYKLKDALDTLNPKLKAEGLEHKVVRPLFISVDPKRDSPEVVKKYLEEFHEDMVGLTGSVSQIADVAHKYRVYFNASQMAYAQADDYIVDHSIIMYLIDPQGYFVHFYGQNVTAAQMASDIFKRIKYWKPSDEPESVHAKGLAPTQEDSNQQ